MIIQKISEYLVQGNSVLYSILAINIVLILLAPAIVARVSPKDAAEAVLDFRINVIRGLSVLVIVLLGYLRFYGQGQSGQGIWLKAISVIVIIYSSYLAVHLIGRFVRLRYGRPVQVGNNQRIADTYASRALSISISVFIALVALISIIRVAGFSSLLEAGGVIGFIGVFLALTQSAWAPDIISGLIILNSKMFEERDVIKLAEGDDGMLASVYRTRVFHTELLNLVDNHRVMIRNSKIRDYAVHNLSKFASAKGLRETLVFKIGYDVPPGRIKAFFETAFERAVADDRIDIEEQYPPEIRLRDAGDHAIEWSIHYYTKEAGSIVKSRQFFRQVVLELSMEEGIELASPFTHKSV